jgi:hypothetical protein
MQIGCSFRFSTRLQRAPAANDLGGLPIGARAVEHQRDGLSVRPRPIRTFPRARVRARARERWPLPIMLGLNSLCHRRASQRQFVTASAMLRHCNCWVYALR